MKVNENLLRISASSIYIENPLDLGTDVTMVIQGTVVKSEDKDNQDGTCDRVFTVKGEIALQSYDIIREEERL